jgi:hypothetical protein
MGDSAHEINDMFLNAGSSAMAAASSAMNQYWNERADQLEAINDRMEAIEAINNKNRQINTNRRIHYQNKVIDYHNFYDRECKNYDRWKSTGLDLRVRIKQLILDGRKLKKEYEADQLLHFENQGLIYCNNQILKRLVILIRNLPDHPVTKSIKAYVRDENLSLMLDTVREKNSKSKYEYPDVSEETTDTTFKDYAPSDSFTNICRKWDARRATLNVLFSESHRLVKLQSTENGSKYFYEWQSHMNNWIDFHAEGKKIDAERRAISESDAQKNEQFFKVINDSTKEWKKMYAMLQLSSSILKALSVVITMLGDKFQDWVKVANFGDEKINNDVIVVIRTYFEENEAFVNDLQITYQNMSDLYKEKVSLNQDSLLNYTVSDY